MTKPGPKEPHDGMFKPGDVGNPTGINGIVKGYQDFRTRALHLLDTLSVQEILDRVRSVALPKDAPAEMKAKHKITMAMPGRDLAIIMRIADSFTTGGGAGLDKLLDRVIGRPTESLVINQRIDAHVTHHEANRLETVREIEQWINDIIVAEPEKGPALPVPE